MNVEKSWWGRLCARLFKKEKPEPLKGIGFNIGSGIDNYSEIITIIHDLGGVTGRFRNEVLVSCDIYQKMNNTVRFTHQNRGTLLSFTLPGLERRPSAKYWARLRTALIKAAPSMRRAVDLVSATKSQSRKQAAAGHHMRHSALSQAGPLGFSYSSRKTTVKTEPSAVATVPKSTTTLDTHSWQPEGSTPEGFKPQAGDPEDNN